jgi:hypothetical protein
VSETLPEHDPSTGPSDAELTKARRTVGLCVTPFSCSTLFFAVAAYVRPSDKSLKKIKAKLTQLSGRNLTALPLDAVVEPMNRSLRGWATYFHFRNSSGAMNKARNHAETRLRTHLMKRHKVKDRRGVAGVS